MDKHLKERLVGAAVLVAAAIILIPEMLSGPRDPSSAPNGEKAAAGEGALKSYTIDLQSPKVRDSATSAPTPLPPAQEAIETTPAPPPEELVVKAEANDKSAEKPTEKAIAIQAGDSAKVANAAPAAKPVSDAVKPSTEKTASEKSSTDATAAKTVAPKASDKTAEKSIDRPAEKTLAASPVQSAAASDHKWAVQVASLSTRANADKAVADLKAKGQAAFVSSFQSKGQTLYRVRIGPVVDRAAADALLKKVKPLYPGANVVAHP